MPKTIVNVMGRLRKYNSSRVMKRVVRQERKRERVWFRERLGDLGMKVGMSHIPYWNLGTS
jgi:hypothetical protein